jgi:hypothetical protein
MIAMASNGHLQVIRFAQKVAAENRNVLFNADTAPYAKELRDEGDLVRGLHLDTEFACATVIRFKSGTRSCDEYRPIFTTGHDFFFPYHRES